MEGLLVLLHFLQSSLNEWICSEGLLPTKEDDMLKQSQAFLSIRWLSFSSCSDSRPRTMETAIFVKSHLKKWLFSLPRGANQRLELSKSSNTRFTEFTKFARLMGRRAARGIPERISRFDWGVLKMAPMANRRRRRGDILHCTYEEFSYWPVPCCTTMYWYALVCTILPDPVQGHRIPDGQVSF
jgi:hypothetical protein